MVIGAGAQPRLLMPFTSDQRRLRDLARGLKRRMRREEEGRHPLCPRFLKRGSLDRVVVISDGAFTGAEEFAKAGEQLRFIKVTGGKDNVGIVGFEVRRHVERPAPVEIMIYVCISPNEHCALR